MVHVAAALGRRGDYGETPLAATRARGAAVVHAVETTGRCRVRTAGIVVGADLVEVLCLVQRTPQREGGAARVRGRHARLTHTDRCVRHHDVIFTVILDHHRRPPPGACAARRIGPTQCDRASIVRVVLGGSKRIQRSHSVLIECHLIELKQSLPEHFTVFIHHVTNR